MLNHFKVGSARVPPEPGLLQLDGAVPQCGGGVQPLQGGLRQGRP